MAAVCKLFSFASCVMDIVNTVQVCAIAGCELDMSNQQLGYD